VWVLTHIIIIIPKISVNVIRCGYEGHLKTMDVMNLENFVPRIKPNKQFCYQNMRKWVISSRNRRVHKQVILSLYGVKPL